MSGKFGKHSKRWIALEVIRTEWAKHGKDTQASMRAFIENRVSKAARDEAAMLGLRQYDRRKNVSGKFIKRNQVYFRSRGRTKLGWIHQSTPTRYLIWFRENGKEKSVWRGKDLVSFRKNGRRAPKPKNPCPWPPRQNVSRATIERAARLSQRFHGLRPRRVDKVRITWPKALVLIGNVVRLDYLSDKEDGKQRIYTHDFGSPVQVFASGSARSGQKNILLLHGRFAITEKGIVG